MTKVITLSELAANIRRRRSGKTLLIAYINQCKDSDAVIIQENATNGDVIKAIFPSIENRLDERTGIMLVKWVDGTTKTFKARWWNAPYKGSEG